MYRINLLMNRNQDFLFTMVINVLAIKVMYIHSEGNTCVSLIKLQASGYNFIKKETPAQVFSCELCEIYKNTFSYRTTPVAASVYFKLRYG